MATRSFEPSLSRESIDVSIIWHPVLPASEFPAEGKLAVQVGGWSALLARTDEGLFAVNDRCTHQGSQLSGGRIRRGSIMCPLHGARFNVIDGKCAGNSYPDLRTFEVKVENGMILVAVPDTPPGLDETPIVI